MVLYFSGTGNSRYVANVIANITADKMVSINELLKQSSKEALSSEKPFTFVCPVYAWRIPRVVDKWIRMAHFEGNREAYFVLTCGEDIGNAGSYAKRTCEETDLLFKGLASVVMPENYIAMFDIPNASKIKETLDAAESRILEVADNIKNNQYLPNETVKTVDRMKSGIVNSVFYHTIISARGFYSTEACISCEKCQELCPLNNIRMLNGKPNWGKACTHCMACICGCPTEAIEYKNKTKGKPRYYNKQVPNL